MGPAEHLEKMILVPKILGSKSLFDRGSPMSSLRLGARCSMLHQRSYHPSVGQRLNIHEEMR